MLRLKMQGVTGFVSVYFKVHLASTGVIIFNSTVLSRGNFLFSDRHFFNTATGQALIKSVSLAFLFKRKFAPATTGRAVHLAFVFELNF